MNVSQIYDGEAMRPAELKIEIDLENDLPKLAGTCK
jgi:hypothetical protein